MKKNLNIPTPEELLAMAENQPSSWKDDDFAKSAAEGVRFMEKPENMLDISDRLNHQIMGSVQAPVANKLPFNSMQIMALAASVCLLAVFTFMFMQNKVGDAMSEQSMSMMDTTDLAFEESPLEEELNTKSTELEKIDSERPANEARGRREEEEKAVVKESVAIEHKKNAVEVAKKEVEKSIVKAEEAKPVFIGDADGFGAVYEDVAIADGKIEKLGDIVAIEIEADEEMLESAGSARTADKTLMKAKSMKDDAMMNIKSSKLITLPYQSTELDVNQNKVFNNSINYFQQADYNKATDELDKLIVEKPNSLELNYQQGINYLYQGRVSKAKKYFEKASELKTGNAMAQIDFAKLNQLLKDKKIDEAKAYINQFALKDGKVLKK